MDYPDPNYAGPPDYGPGLGEDCSTPKPATFYDALNVCRTVTTSGTITTTLVVDGVTYVKTLMQNMYDGKFYYVLAAALPDDFVPPPLPPKD